MSKRPKTDRRPARSDSKAAGPARAIPAGQYKCQLCGRTRPVEHRQPGLPPEWESCRGCWARSQDTSNKHKNPGEAVRIEEVLK